jgi:membrane-bound ClpP family serine protease
MADKQQQQKVPSRSSDLPLTKENYMLMAIGFVIIVIGFILMTGGKAESPEQFNPEIFNFRRITLAPILVLFGFLFEIYAIMKKPKEQTEDSPKEE